MTGKTDACAMSDREQMKADLHEVETCVLLAGCAMTPAVRQDDIETVRSISDCSDTVVTEADSASLVRIADFLEALNDCSADRDELFAVNTRQREALNVVASILEIAVRYLRSEASFDELFQGARDVAPFRNVMAAHGLGPVGEDKPARRSRKK